MVDVTIEADRAIFEIEGLDKLWSLRSRLEIPLKHITNVEADPSQVSRWWHGFKVIGTDVPGLFAAGTFYQQRGLLSWDMPHLENTIIVSLEHERPKKLSVEVADTATTRGQLQTALTIGAAEGEASGAP